MRNTLDGVPSRWGVAEVDTHHDVKVARLLVIIAAAYALLGGVILVAVVVSWEAQVVFAPSISGSGCWCRTRWVPMGVRRPTAAKAAR